MRFPFCLLAMVAFGAGDGVRFDHIGRDRGLSQSAVLCMLQDRRGFMWFGTEDGLNRFDGYDFTVFQYHDQEPDSLRDDYINDLTEGPDGRIWLGTRTGGLYGYRGETADLTRFQPADGTQLQGILTVRCAADNVLWVGMDTGLRVLDAQTGVDCMPEMPTRIRALLSGTVSALAFDALHRVWLGTDTGLLRYDPQTKDVVHYTAATHGLPPGAVGALLADGNGVYVGCTGGVARYLAVEDRFEQLQLEPPETVSTDHFRVESLALGRDGVLWIATNAGLVRFQQEGADAGAFVRYRHHPGDTRSLSHDRLRTVYEDADGVLWVGSWGGSLSRLDRLREPFGHVYAQPNDPTGLAADHVWSFYEGGDGVLWVGTEGQGLCRRDPDGRFTTYRDLSGDSAELGNDVHALAPADAGRLWLGTFGGLKLFDPQIGKVVKTYRHDPMQNDSLSDNHLWTTYRDPHGTVWVGTELGGLCRLKPDGGFQRYTRTGDPDGLQHPWVMSLLRDNKDRMWVGSFGGGLHLLQDEAAGRFRVFAHRVDDPQSLSNDNISSILEDTRGRGIWVATFGGGLNLLDPDTGKCRIWREREGLPDINLYGVLDDQQGRLWFSTNDGLVRLNPDDGNLKVYRMSDGLQDNEFNSGAYHKGASGRLYFGGLKGYNGFFPNRLLSHEHPPRMVFTALLRDNKVVAPEPDNPESLLPQPLAFTSRLSLRHTDKVISFRFAALHYAAPEENRYAYQLEGFNDNWIETDAANRRATFTGLDHGDYLLRVKGANKDGVWNDEGIQLALHVLPPPWLTLWARAGYVLVVCGLVYLYVRRQRRRLNQARAVNTRLKQVDRLRDDFLANTSHELRTPLNGIIGISESLIEGTGALDPVVRHNLEMVATSGRRLKALVDDILDFSKLKHDSLTLQCRAVALRPVVDLVLTMCTPMLRTKGVRLVNEVPPDLVVHADEDRLHQIFYNLVGNAVRFTDAGEVRVTAGRAGEFVEITVQDSGVGIPVAHQDRVFESFVQVPGGDFRGGTGLGLALTRRLVHLHGGTISLTSEPGAGTRVLFTMPISRELPEVAPAQPAVSRLHRFEADQPSACVPAPITAHAGFHLLVVDDEPINRQVLINHLADQAYRITQAGDGEEALALLRKAGDIDLVLLDIMMPGMDGFETCRRLRKDAAQSELPVIFLTARNQVGDLVAAYDAGGNDYLTKPVARAELSARVGLHLQQLQVRRRLAEMVVEEEALNRIVMAINREPDLDAMLDAMLEQGLKYFPEAHAATVFLRREDAPDTFRVAAGRGYQSDALLRMSFPREFLLERYVARGVPLEKGVSSVNTIRNVQPLEGLDGFDVSRAMLCIPLAPRGVLEGFLVLDNHDDPDAFGETDVRRAGRFREHAVWALAKARLLAQLSAHNKAILAAQEQLVMQEKMASIGFLAAGVTHEVKNPTGFVIGSIQNLLHDLGLFRHFLLSLLDEDGDPDMRREIEIRLDKLKEHGDIVREGAERINGIVRDLGAFSRRDAHRETVDLTANLMSTLNLARANYKHSVAITIAFDEPVVVSCFPSQLNQVFMNLVINACQAVGMRADAGKPVSGNVRVETAREDEWWVIRFIDDGVGIAADKLEKVFDPFFTTKDVGEGTGLGLAISRKIVTDHGGRLTVTSVEGEGTTFSIYLPAAAVPVSS